MDARGHLLQLEEERVLALREELGGTSAYMNDLDAELEHRRALYVGAAVTEIATLRASFSALRPDERPGMSFWRRRISKRRRRRRERRDGPVATLLADVLLGRLGPVRPGPRLVRHAHNEGAQNGGLNP